MRHLYRWGRIEQLHTRPENGHLRVVGAPEAFRTDARTYVGYYIAGGQNGTTVDLRSNTRASTCPRGRLEVNDKRHGFHPNLGPFPQAATRYFCAASTDAYGNVGPWADATEFIRDLAAPAQNTVRVGIGANNPVGTNPDGWNARIYGSAWSTSNTGAQYYRYRYVNDRGSQIGPVRQVTTRPYSTVTGIPYNQTIHLQVAACHRDRAGDDCQPWSQAADSLRNTGGVISSSTRGARKRWAIDQQNTTETPTWSVTKNVYVRSDRGVSCGPIATPGGEWTATGSGRTLCYGDLGGNPYTGYGNGGSWTGQKLPGLLQLGVQGHRR